MPLLTGQKNILGRSLPASWLLEQLSRARMTSSWPRVCVFLPRLRNRHELLTCASWFCTHVRHRGPPESARSQRGWQAGSFHSRMRLKTFAFHLCVKVSRFHGLELVFCSLTTEPDRFKCFGILHLNLLEQSLKSEYF